MNGIVALFMVGIFFRLEAGLRIPNYHRIKIGNNGRKKFLDSPLFFSFSK